jgi:hypothetical protein
LTDFGSDIPLTYRDIVTCNIVTVVFWEFQIVVYQTFLRGADSCAQYISSSNVWD